MNVVAIISEYNPFHSGHKYHISKIREELGEDSAIVAIMSGNFTQRAEVAVIDKFIRAKAAALSGVNLVLELPFPYSSSSAEFFAMAGVHIATFIGATHLSFGSESSDINTLSLIASRMLSNDYVERVINRQKTIKEIGYPSLLEEVYSELYSTSLSGFFTPNNILALEYLKAISRQKSPLIPHTIKRLGADYNDDKISLSQHQSASAIRGLMNNDFNAIEKYVPFSAMEVYKTAYQNGEAPASTEKLASAILSFLRLNPPPTKKDIHDAGGGLYNRLHKCSYEASDLQTLITLADTKKFTSARIRRAILNSFFGVTSSNVKELPEYTQVLAMDNIGKAILKNVSKRTDFAVITKPSSFSHASEKAKMQKKISDAADSVFQLTKPIPSKGNASLKSTPFILN